MIRRWLAALQIAALLVGQTASAGTVLVIHPDKDYAIGAGTGVFKVQQTGYWRSLLDRGGVSARFVEYSDMRTDWARRATWKNDKGDSTVYDATIVLGFSRNGVNGTPARFDPDSLTFGYRNWASKPVLFVGYPNGASLTTSGGICSTGVMAAVSQAAGRDTTSSLRYVGNLTGAVGSAGAARGSPFVWKAKVIYSHESMRMGGFEPDYMWQPLVSVSHTRNTAPGVCCYINADSTDDWSYVVTDVDTVTMWRNSYSNGNAAYKPHIFASWSNSQNDRGDTFQNLLALAALDSSAGGVLIPTDAYQGGIIVDGLCARNSTNTATNNVGGIAPGDTVAEYASFDSLATLDVPITFGVNTNADSLAAYASELYNAMRRVPRARFAPRTSLDYATALTAGAIEIGERAALMRLAAYVGMNRISRTLIPASTPSGFDWAPVGWKARIGEDSLYAAFYNAGYSAVFADYDDANAASGADTALAPGYEQASVRIKYGAGAGQYLRIVKSTMGYSTTTARRNLKIANDYATTTIAGMVLNQGSENTIDGQFTNTRARGRSSIAVIMTGNLGSTVQGYPANWGWYYIKWVANRARAVNAAAGRRVFQLTYPEYIRP